MRYALIATLVFLMGGSMSTAVPAPQPRLGLFMSQSDIEAARVRAETLPWAIAQKEKILAIADSWVARDPEWIRSIMPPPGSKFAYGVQGCPACQKKWKYFGGDTANLDRPLVLECPHCHTVFDLANPREPYNDTGDGITLDGKKYWLCGTWNGFVINSVWSAFSPDAGALWNLADAYALTGDERYARQAIVIMDALATLSPTTKGPRDFTNDENSVQGRLMHLTSIYFRAMNPLSRVLDMVGRHPDLKTASPTNPGITIEENIRKGLYEDYLFVPYNTRNANLRTLHNHEADSYRALVLTGLTWGIGDYVRWGAEGFQAFLDNAIDGDGLYYETSLSYSVFTRTVYTDIADALMRYNPDVYPVENKMPARSELAYEGNFFNHPSFARFTVDVPDRVSMLGRQPTFGNNHFDTTIWKEPGRIVTRSDVEQAIRFAMYSTDPGIRMKAAKSVVASADRIGDPTGGGIWGWWPLYHNPDMEAIRSLAGSEPVTEVEEESDFFSAKSLIYLRAGKDADRRGVVLRTGPNLPHTHEDQMGILLFGAGRALSGDIGYGIFGNHVHLGWATHAIAHNLVVVNQGASSANKMARVGPGGSMRRFHQAPGVAFVEADLTRMFPASDGVSDYRRLLVQVDLGPGSSYWVDLFDVAGGTVHDYSMHGKPFAGGNFSVTGVSPVTVPNVWTLAGLDPQWTGATFDTPLQSWGERLTPGGLLRMIPGLDDVSSNIWWYAPPGNGYGFIYDIKAAKTSSPWQAAWRWIDNNDRYGFRVMMLPIQQQQVITGTGPTLDGSEKMRWLVARQGSPENKEPINSRFASVLEIFSGAQTITSTEALMAGARAVGVKVKAPGREDWIIDARKGLVKMQEIGELNAGIAVIRRQNKKLSGMVLSGGRALTVDGFSVKMTNPVWTGKVTSVDPEGRSFRVSPPLPACAAGSAFRFSNPGYTHDSMYRADAVASDGLVRPYPDDLTLGRGKVNGLTDGGFLASAPLVTANIWETDTHYLDGKSVVSGGQTGVIDTVKGFKTILQKGLTPRAGDSYVVLDAQAGDTVSMDGTLSLTMEGAEWVLRSNSPVAVGFPFPVEMRVKGAWQAVKGNTVELDAETLAFGPVRFREPGRKTPAKAGGSVKGH
jgi:hypothetical protein